MMVKVPDFGTNEADIIQIKNESFHVCGRISICPFNTYIHFSFVKAGQCATKNLKSSCGPAKLKDNKKLKPDK